MINVMPTLKELQEVTRQANEGDKVALQRLRAILDDNPQIWSQLGDVAEYAVLAIVRLIGAGDSLRQEATLRKAKQLEKELAGVSPTPTERLVVQSVVLSWLQTMYVDTIHPMPDGASLQQLRFRLQLKDSASRRYQQALKSLVTIRKLLSAASTSTGELQLPHLQETRVSDPPANGRHPGNGRANGKPRKKRRSAKTDQQPVNRIVPFLPERAGTT